MNRRTLLAAIGLAALPVSAATAQIIIAPAGWYQDQRRREDYERWRESEWQRRDRDPRHRRAGWNRERWAEQQERDAWARRQGWYRRY